MKGKNFVVFLVFVQKRSVSCMIIFMNIILYYGINENGIHWAHIIVLSSIESSLCAMSSLAVS